MPNKKILGLYGAADKGKTRTLRMLIDLLNSRSISYSIDDTNEVCVYRGHTIVVTTRGDNADLIERNVEFMRKHPWDIAITATRTRGGSCDTILAYAKEIDAVMVWKKKCYGEPFDDINLRCAKALLADIDVLIDEMDSGRQIDYFVEPNVAEDGAYVVAHKEASLWNAKGEFEIMPFTWESFHTEKEANDLAKKLSTTI